jgi:hypothetical protein
MQLQREPPFLTISEKIFCACLVVMGSVLLVAAPGITEFITFKVVGGNFYVLPLMLHLGFSPSSRP